MGAGVQLLDSLQLSADVANNEVYAKSLVDTRDEIRNGKNLANALRNKAGMSDMFVALVDVGEETGQLDALLSKYAEILEQEVEAKVDALTSIIEPVMIVIFGGLVGGMVISLYMPLVNIFKFIQ